MKGQWIKWSKIVLLLVCFGFFMPISCNLNGPALARMFKAMNSPKDAVLVFLVLVAAMCSVVYSIFYRDNLENESIIVDWFLLGASILGGVLSVGQKSREYLKLQFGAYTIIVGWTLSFMLLFIASFAQKEIETKALKSMNSENLLLNSATEESASKKINEGLKDTEKQLQEIKELYEQNLIDEDEYKAKKKQILKL